MKYVLLLRGINVGKSIKISMKDLKSWLGEIGLRNVSTYLNSGNALFESETGREELSETVSRIIEDKCGAKVPVLVKTSAEIIGISESIPEEWQNDETQQTYIAYLFDEAADEAILDTLPIKREYVQIYYINKALVWNIRREFYNKSRIANLAGHRAYEYMTTRNVNTARKLAELCSA